MPNPDVRFVFTVVAGPKAAGGDDPPEVICMDCGVPLSKLAPCEFGPDDVCNDGCADAPDSCEACERGRTCGNANWMRFVARAKARKAGPLLGAAVVLAAAALGDFDCDGDYGGDRCTSCVYDGGSAGCQAPG